MIRIRWKSVLMPILAGFLLVAVGDGEGWFSSTAGADELNRCLAEELGRADDSMTVGQLRRLCAERLVEGIAQTAGDEGEVVEKRLRQDDENVLEPFTLMAHKPNYILFGAYNSAGWEEVLYQEQANDATITADDVEAQFQVSIKLPLMLDLFDRADLYAAYTNHSFWQVYNKDVSAPFRETNHEPEIWLQFEPEWEFGGFRNTVNRIGLVHQSNGQAGVLSRSWNRVYANLIFEWGNLALSFKPWFRIPEDHEDDDNPDINDYLGHYEIRAAYKINDHVISLMSRNNLESGFDNGALEMTWSFPLGSYPYLKGYLQYFTGYGESLIDYDQYVNKIGLSLAITDWL